MEWPCRARTLISTVCSWVNIDGLEKAAKLAQVDQFYFAGVGQFYTAANTLLTALTARLGYRAGTLQNSFSLICASRHYCRLIGYSGSVRSTMDDQQGQEVAILRRPQVEKRTGLTKSGIYFLIREGDFPRPVRLGKRAVGWIESEITTWLREKTSHRSLVVRG